MDDSRLIEKLEKEIKRKLRRVDDRYSINQFDENAYKVNKDGKVVELYLWEKWKGTLSRRLENVPLIIFEFSELMTLNLWENRINKIPQEISSLKKLKRLNLSFNHLDKIPKEVGELTNLKEIKLFQNYISLIPDEIGKLHRLEYLSLSSNNLNEFPKGIIKLINLKTLHLDYNKIEIIPHEIDALQCLQELNLRKNMIKSLPKEIGNLRSLSYLELKENQIHSLPLEICNLKLSIKLGGFRPNGGIFLEENPIQSPPIELIKQGDIAIKEYFKSLIGEKKSINEIKVQEVDMKQKKSKREELPFMYSNSITEQVMKSGELDTAEKVLKAKDNMKILFLGNKTTQKKVSAINNGVWGNFYAYQANYNTAEKYYQKAMEIFGGLDKFSEGMGITYANLGGIYELMGKTSSAVKHWKKAQAVFSKLEDEWRLGLVVKWLATLPAQKEETWKVVMPGGGIFNIGGTVLDFEAGIFFTDVTAENYEHLTLKDNFLAELAETLKTQKNYRAVKGMEVTVPEGYVLREQKFEVGAIIGLTQENEILGLLYIIKQQYLDILGLWPEKLTQLYEKDNDKFFKVTHKLISDPHYFNAVFLLFPEYYPWDNA